MTYHQITPGERYMLSALRKQGLSNAAIAHALGRHRSTIGREICRNTTHPDGYYRAERAQEATNGRRSRSRRNSHFSRADWATIESLLAQWLSPEQISGRLRREAVLEISHESIYTHVWRDKQRDGQLYRLLRQPTKRRKRYGTYEKRGRLLGKRPISERPASVERRREFGHWEMDTVIGAGDTHCIVTLVERLSGFVLLGKLTARSVAALNHRLIQLIRRHPTWFKTITTDNGTEFHGYTEIERATGVPVYFATPYNSWERGTNENTNGLIRQYLPKRTSMRELTQAQCDAIARHLNHRPRKRLAYRSPIECLQQLRLC
jgi:transposase, IS30 family